MLPQPSSNGTIGDERPPLPTLHESSAHQSTIGTTSQTAVSNFTYCYHYLTNAGLAGFIGKD